jgi:hypothetical protein
MTRFLGFFCIATAVLAFGACDSPLAPASPPPPQPPPGYQLSGIVTDDNGSPVANHEVAVEAFFTGHKQATTSTNADGHYEMVLDTFTPVIYASFVHAGGGEYEHHYAKALPSETANIVKNLRLRRIRTVEAGQSIVISIDRDSSLAVDGGDWWEADHVWEKLHVRVAEAGTLTVDARPEVGGIVPSYMVTVGCDGIHNCRVNANSLVEIRVAIPTGSAPQRYEVATSLQR